MNIILSRKGFDSTYGQVASPILEGGELLSLPIPEERGTVAYADLRHRGLPVPKLLTDLAPDLPDRCHLDPDLDRTALPRVGHWRPAFGQAEAAGRHLDLQGVSPGDLFLFFGWFRRVETVAGHWRYVADAPNLHVLWGWLRVGTILRPPADQCPRSLGGHPHFDGRERPHNRVYVGSTAADGGVFTTLRRHLVLTADGSSRSRWRLPGAFLPHGRTPLTYHGNSARWRDEGATCLLRSVGRGQEFVLDSRHYPDVASWAEHLIARAGRPASCPRPGPPQQGPCNCN